MPHIIYFPAVPGSHSNVHPAQIRNAGLMPTFENMSFILPILATLSSSYDAAQINIVSFNPEAPSSRKGLCALCIDLSVVPLCYEDLGYAYL